MKQQHSLVSLSELCRLLGYSKQAYYKAKKAAPAPNNDQTILEKLRQIRQLMPRLGIRKCIEILEQQADYQPIRIGRDRLFKLAKAHGLLVEPMKTYVKTTDSKGWMRQFANLVKGIKITRPEQVWVADITYLGKGLFLHLVTDAYSKQIMGFAVANDLTKETSLTALEMAFQQRSWPKNSLIHHSDRGLQYMSKLYCGYLTSQGALSSSTQDGSPYDNAIAERVNGILKQEFMLENAFQTVADATAGVAQAVMIYNHYRPHYSNHMLTPVKMHSQDKLEMKTWKKRLPSSSQRKEEAGSAEEQPASNSAGRYTDGKGALPAPSPIHLASPNG